MEKKHENIVFFEKINSVFYPIVKQYLKKNFIVYFFEIEDKYKENSHIKKFINKKKIINTSDLIFDFSLYRLAGFYAHKNVDYFFNKHYSKTRSIKLMQKLLNFPKIIDMYKKEVAIQLENSYYLELKINNIIKNYNFSTCFFPSSNFKIYTDKNSLLNKNVKIIRIRKIINFKNKIKKIFFLGLPVYVFLRKIKKIKKIKKRKEFKVGIMVSHPKNIFSMNYYFTESLLINNIELPKEFVLFIDDSTKDVNINEYKKRGYNYTRLSKDKEIISWNLLWNKIIKRFFPVWFKSLLLSIVEESLIIDTNSKILLDYMKWSIFIDSYNIKNYTRNMIIDNMSVTHVLSQDNIKTWYCFFDCTSMDFHLDWDEQKKNQVYFSFIYYDNIIIYGNVNERWFRKHRNFIKNYFKVGVLHSQIIDQLKNKKLKSPLYEMIEKKNLSGKIIGVFDSGFFNWGPNKIKDGIKFSNNILKLLTDFPEISIIFKTKKELELVPFLKPIYKKLKNHKRCLLVARYDKEGVSASEVIALSDLIISLAYTSTSYEALCAKIKSIYYEPGGYDIGQKYYLNRIPNFVAHNYEDLKKLINYWLYEITDKEFEKFLDDYIKNEMDAYLDGKSLSRIRKLFMK